MHGQPSVKILVHILVACDREKQVLWFIS